MAESEKTLGLIAGGGRLPFLVAEGAKKAGLKIVCAGLSGSADINLSGHVDCFKQVAIARPGSWIRHLRRYGASRAIMVGKVYKEKLYTPFRILKYLPDWRAVRIYYWRLRKQPKRDNNILNCIAEELACGGIFLEDSVMYCTEHLADKGIMTKHALPEKIQNDIDFGWKVVKRLGEFDIGQAVAVKDGVVLAVEAVEGTASMIERAGALCRSGGWTLIKAEKPDQDRRFDVPCVGPDTVRSLVKNGGKCLVVEAQKTIMIDKPQTIALANELGIIIIGC